jgi:hypothetical protein
MSSLPSPPPEHAEQRRLLWALGCRRAADRQADPDLVALVALASEPGQV